jgi:hypothetical protein
MPLNINPYFINTPKDQPTTQQRNLKDKQKSSPKPKKQKTINTTPHNNYTRTKQKIQNKTNSPTLNKPKNPNQTQTPNNIKTKNHSKTSINPYGHKTKKQHQL